MGVQRHAEGQQLRQGRADAILDLARGALLFREIIESGFRMDLESGGLQPGGKLLIPFCVVGFAAGQRHGGDGRKPAQEMRRGEFDDAPDAAGPQMIMDNDQIHVRARRKIVAAS